MTDLGREHMTFKIQRNGRDEERRLIFEGLLDRAALAELTGRCGAEFRRGGRVHVWFRAGTQVEAGVLDELVRVEGISLTAEAPFLARWIKNCLERSRAREP